MKILIIVGSLRAASFTKKLAETACALGPEGSEFEIIDGRDLPLYDEDLDGEEKPAAVQTMLDRVNASDALVFMTPEFNYGIPGPLKNLVDWASRPAYNSPLKGVPALVIAHSIAPSGGARAHGQLTSVLGGTLTPVFVAPSFLIPAMHEKFDESGALTDEVTRGRLEMTLAAFEGWAASVL